MRSPQIFKFGEFLLNTGEETLWCGGKSVKINHRTFQVLRLLVENSGEIVSKQKFFETVWADTFVEDNSLTVTLTTLRKILGDKASDAKFIENIPKKGYRFIGVVEVVNETTNSKAIESDRFLDELKQRKVLVGIFTGVLMFLVVGFGVYFQTKGNITRNKWKPSLAVLPFTNLHPGEDTNYLGYAFADTINVKLTSMHTFRVFPSSVMAKYRDPQIPFEQISHELNAEYIVSGTYLKESGHINITAQVIDVAKNETLFQDSFQLNFEELSQLQEIIARRLITELRLRPSEMDSLASLANINPQAYNFFLKGIEEYSKVQLDPSIENLERAVALEPDFAEAWNRLGTSYMVNASTRFGGSEYYQKAEQAFQKSIELNPNNSAPQIHLADMMIETDHKKEAVKILLKVIEKEPENSLAWWELSYAYRYAGMLEKSIEAGEKAKEVDPGFFLRTAVPNYYLYTGQYEKFKSALPQRSDSSYIKFYQGFAEFHLNNRESAKQLFDEAYQLDPNSMQTQIGKSLSYFISGEKEKAVNFLNETEKEILEKNVSDGEGIYKVAQAFAILGENKKALKMFRLSVDKGFFCYPYFQNDPLLKSINQEIEFKEILGLSQTKYNKFNFEAMNSK